jgi:uncharacterized protein with NRDE domain
VCLLVVLSRTDPEHPLVVGANRDERLDRPAIAATVLSAEGPRVIGGRDLLAGGTWLAVNEHGVVAGLTNRPSPAGRDPSKRSRGELPLALAQHTTAADAVDEFVGRFAPSDFNSAWLMVGDRSSLFYVQLGDEDAPVVQPLAPGVHVLGNGPLGAPSPKTDQVLDRLAGIATLEPESVLGRVRAVVADHTVPPAVAEADTGGRPKELACACVHTADYGTRSSALVQVPAAGRPRLWVADGPPCTAPFASVDELWTESPAADDGARLH